MAVGGLLVPGDGLWPIPLPVCLLFTRHFNHLQDEGGKSEERTEQNAQFCNSHTFLFQCGGSAAPNDLNHYVASVQSLPVTGFG